MMDKLFVPPSQLPYRNRLVYLLQTKLQAELSPDVLHDIDHALYDYAKFCAKVERNEREVNGRIKNEGRAINDAEVAIEFIAEWYRKHRAD